MNKHTYPIIEQLPRQEFGKKCVVRFESHPFRKRNTPSANSLECDSSGRKVLHFSERKMGKKCVSCSRSTALRTMTIYTSSMCGERFWLPPPVAHPVVSHHISNIYDWIFPHLILTRSLVGAQKKITSKRGGKKVGSNVTPEERSKDCTGNVIRETNDKWSRGKLT